MVRWPIYASNFNRREYTSVQEILSDLELLVRDTLQNQLNISGTHLKVRFHCISVSWSSKVSKNYSAVLVIPDLYDRAYVREMINMLIYSLGFKQVCAQQVLRTPVTLFVSDPARNPWPPHLEPGYLMRA
jgi:actin-related protein 8